MSATAMREEAVQLRCSDLSTIYVQDIKSYETNELPTDTFYFYIFRPNLCEIFIFVEPTWNQLLN